MVETTAACIIGGVAVSVGQKAMKSAYQIAKDLGITPQAIYKRIFKPAILKQLEGHYEKVGRIHKFDEEAEKIIKELYNPVVQPEPYTLYRHSLPNGKVYIGITSLKPYVRWSGGNGYRDNKEFYEDIKKYGWNNIEHEIIKSGLSKIEAEEEEYSLIIKHESYKNERGYNKYFSVPWFNRTIEPGCIEPGENYVTSADPLCNLLKNELEYLRTQLEVERQRSHELTMQIVQLTQNNQVLLGVVQQKKPWWRRWWK
jgi:hypothetical protein